MKEVVVEEDSGVFFMEVHGPGVHGSTGEGARDNARRSRDSEPELSPGGWRRSAWRWSRTRGGLLLLQWRVLRERPGFEVYLGLVNNDLKR